MRVLKEVLVLAVLVLVLAYAARQLEDVNAGRMESGVPPLMESLKKLLGWYDSKGGTAPNPVTPSE
jgi:hypothetical protein